MAAETAPARDRDELDTISEALTAVNATLVELCESQRLPVTTAAWIIARTHDRLGVSATELRAVG